MIIESGGGTRDSKQARNRDYATGLTLILTRLRDAGLLIADALVDSGHVAKLPDDQRRLALPYPITIGDPDALRKELGRAMASVGREPNARGSGNREKRLRLVLAPSALSATALADLLAGAPVTIPNE